MAVTNVNELFERLVVARTSAEVQVLLKELGDSGSVGLNEKFGPLNCAWVAYGGSESNESTIGLASKPGRSLTERITNSMDAMLELARTRSPDEPPKSPSLAAQEWYGRPVTGPREGLFQSEGAEGDLSRSTAVILADSGIEGAPTIDVVDDGIGLSASEMSDTILSLQHGNKVKKPYLIGAFGQGGASTLAFCDKTIIISRNRKAPDEVGFTIVRLVDPGDDYELDVYAYLVVDGAIPAVNLGAEAVKPYSDTNLSRPPELAHGTLVRHVGFELGGLNGSLGPTPGNPYHFLHLSMFDPILPFRVMDIRVDQKGEARFRDERIGGSRNRLMKLVEKSDEQSSSRVSVIHHREMEYIVPLGSTEPSIGVEYWVVEAMRKSGGDLTLRASSNEQFVQRGYPVVATLNGQNQGELPAKFIKDLGLGMVAKHIVVHIDASKTDRSTRRALFTTTREGFKDKPQLHNLTTTLANILKDDDRLFEIEQALTDRLVNRESRATSNKVKKQITRLLRDAGFSKTAEGESNEAGEDEGGGPGGGGSRGTGGGGGGGGRPTIPLPTLPFPNVTKWDITAPAAKVRVRLDGRALLRIETDANWRFDDEGLISLEFEPEKVEVASVSALGGGRKQWRLRPAESAKVGDSGTVTAVLRTPNGGELRSAIQFEVLAPITAGKKGPRGRVPDFEVLPISPDKDDDTETWNQLWPSHETASRTTKAEVAYKVFAAGDKTIVYYSTAFGPYVERLERLKSKSAALAELFDENYQVWIGYHAILQLPAEQKAEDDQLEVFESERCRVAQLQLHIAQELAEMHRKVARATDSGEE